MGGNDIERASQNDQGQIHQRRNPNHGTLSLASRPFAGRIGGNQEFTLSPGDSNYHEIVSKIPDAVSTFTWKESFSFGGFADVDLYKEAFIEAVGTCLQLYIAGLYAIGLVPAVNETSLGPIIPAIIGSFANVLLISLFIFAGGPVSGGHFNPLITLSTFTARLSAFPRTVLYILSQCSGAIVAGFLVRGSLGRPPADFRAVPGCYIDPALVTPGQAYVLETMSCFALLFVSFGVGLDPRQKEVFGPALSPILVGFAQALCSFASSIAKPGYSGASMNPARCLGLMAAAERFEYHYIHWTGDITAAVLNGAMYWAIPPYQHRQGR